MKFFSFFTQELAIDLGTANTLIMSDGKVVVDEPSIVAKDRRTNETIAVGHKAMQMHGKTHENIKTVRPLRDGVIADFQAAEDMIAGMINMVGSKRRFFSHLKMVICIPSGITEVEKRAVFDSADHVDSKETYLIYEPMAAALGIGLEVEEPVGNVIIDIGGGTTEIAVVCPLYQGDRRRHPAGVGDHRPRLAAGPESPTPTAAGGRRVRATGRS